MKKKFSLAVIVALVIVVVVVIFSPTNIDKFAYSMNGRVEVLDEDSFIIYGAVSDSSGTVKKIIVAEFTYDADTKLVQRTYIIPKGISDRETFTPETRDEAIEKLEPKEGMDLIVSTDDDIITTGKGYAKKIIITNYE